MAKSKRRSDSGPILPHYVGHLQCALGLRFTGYRNYYDAIIEIALLPLDMDYRIHPELPLFIHQVRPPEEHPHYSKYTFHQPQEVVIGAFEDWRAQLPEHTGFGLICHDWVGKKKFMEDLFMPSRVKHYFPDEHVRCLRTAFNYLKDRQYHHNHAWDDTLPFNSTFKTLTRFFGGECEASYLKSAVGQARNVPEVYNTLLRLTMTGN